MLPRFQVLTALCHGVWQLGWQLLSPDGCAACDAPVDVQAVFCRPCALTVSMLPLDALDTDAMVPVRGLGLYGGALGDALRKLKYDGRSDLARPLGHLLAQRLLQAHEAPRSRYDLIVPVPLHAQRLAERGYNQAALLANRVGALVRVPVRSALVRRQHRRAQAHLSRAERRLNLEGCIEPLRGKQLQGGSILLLDDVCTTGATIDACTAALMAGGARRVEAAVVAQTENEFAAPTKARASPPRSSTGKRP